LQAFNEIVQVVEFDGDELNRLLHVCSFANRGNRKKR
jgi:hypothetical protein